MNRPDPRSGLRRSNPLVMLVTGALLGAMLVALATEPGNSTTRASGSTAGHRTEVAPSGSPSAGASPSGGRHGRRHPSKSPSASPRSSGGTRGSSHGGPTPVSSATRSTAPCATSALNGVQGVTADTIKIGFAVPTLGALALVVSIGNPQQDVEAVLAGMKRRGLLPICGRTITPVFRSFSVLDPSQSRAVCDGFADQDKVFAVVSLFAFAGASCVTQEKHLPLLDSGNALTESQFVASPLLFSDDPPLEAQIRDAAYWAVRSGALNGKSIGVYYNANGPGGADPPGRIVKNDLIDVLARLGHPVKDVVVSTTSLSASNPLASDPTDSVAVRKFKADHIQVVFPMEFSSNFFQQAGLQKYHAQWMVYGTAMVNDATTSSYPDDFSGARGLSFDHVGEVKSGVAVSAQTHRCLAYDAQAGHSAPGPESAAGQTLRETCDPLRTLVAALSFAGRALNNRSFIAGMQAVRGLKASYYSPQSFTADKHWGATQNVAEQWSSGCSCWRVAGRWQPLWWQP